VLIYESNEQSRQFLMQRKDLVNLPVPRILANIKEGRVQSDVAELAN
jgi:hypothetical protein